MTRTPVLLGLLAFASAAPLAVLAQPHHHGAGAPIAATAKPVTTAAVVPPIPFHERRLKNGLRILTALDKATPNVTVQVWYGVGSKDDPKGRSGFAHLFEHMMFKATRDMPAEHMDRLTEDVGGENNASTADDFTDYYELIPANHLQTLLWAEAQRLSSLKVDEANFKSERDVVKEELRQRVLADPYGRFYRLAIPINSYTTHPYKRPGIGSIANLDAATLADVQNFHDTYYRPDNATLVVVGNFDQAQLDKWIDGYFGDIKNPNAPLPRVTIKEPARTGARAVDAYGPTVPLPGVAMTWLIPDARHPDLAPLKVLDAILTTGKSSRLYTNLVYRAQIAQQVLSDAGSSQQPGLFYAGAIMTAGHTPDEGEKAVLAELAKLRTGPVSAAELDRAKNQILAQELRGRETILGRGVELGESTVVEGDPARANTDMAEIMAVTPADITRVVNTYLAENRRVTVRYRAESERPKGEKIANDDAALDAIGTPLRSGTVAPPPPASLPRAEPKPTAPALAAIPAMAERTLSNGVRVIVARTYAAPIVTAELTVKSGAAADTKAGATSMMALLLTEGAGGRTAEQIASTVEAAGGAIGAGAGYDQSRVSLTVLSKEFANTLPIMADVVERPTLSAEELERKRTQKLNALQVAMKQPGGIAGMVIPKLIFGGSGYGNVAGGTTTSVKALTQADIKAAYLNAFRPDQAVLVITGDIEPERAFALAEANFGKWSNTTPAHTAVDASGAAPAPRVTVIDLPGAGQAAVLIAAPSIKRSDPSYYRAEVANGVLGGGYSARLNEEVRVKRGLSYGANSRIDERTSGGLFTASAQTKNESAVEVADLLMREAKKLGTQPIAADELEPRKAALIGGFGREVETSAGLAGLLTDYATNGVPLNEIANFTPKTAAVTAAQAQAAAASAIDPSKISLIIVGDAKLFGAKLKAEYPNAVVIPAASLDLDRADLGAK
jgi:zinc protease